MFARGEISSVWPPAARWRQACPAAPCRNAGRRCRSAGPARRPCSAFPTSGSSRSWGSIPWKRIRGRHGPSGSRPRSALACRPAAAAASRRVGRRRERRFRRGTAVRLDEQGTRPTFDLVTGISTGALTAPFAFLGPDYDPQLRAVYTELTPADILTKRGADRRAVRRRAWPTTRRCSRPSPATSTSDAGRHRPGLRRGPPAADRLDRSRRPGAGDLEHRRDRQERTPAGARHDPPHPARLRRHPRRVSADP